MIRSAIDNFAATEASTFALEPISSKSLHVFSAEDPVLPAEESIRAMGLYKHPAMIVHEGGHNPPFDEVTESKICERLDNLYAFHCGAKLQLEP